jgi:hypothetical protein
MVLAVGPEHPLDGDAAAWAVHSAHPIVPQATAGGILGFEDDAEVEHGGGKENVRLF